MTPCRWQRRLRSSLVETIPRVYGGREHDGESAVRRYA